MLYILTHICFQYSYQPWTPPPLFCWPSGLALGHCYDSMLGSPTMEQQTNCSSCHPIACTYVYCTYCTYVLMYMYVHIIDLIYVNTDAHTHAYAPCTHTHTVHAYAPCTNTHTQCTHANTVHTLTHAHTHMRTHRHACTHRNQVYSKVCSLILNTTFYYLTQL